MQCDGISCCITFNEGVIDEVCCMGLNTKYGKVPVTPFYFKYNQKLDIDAIRSCWLSWLHETFQERVPFWYVYSQREAMMVSAILGRDWYRWWDGSRGVVVEQILSFLNNYSIWTEKSVNVKEFWQFAKALRIKHEFATQRSPQQAYLLPDMVRMLAHNVRVVRDLVY